MEGHVDCSLECRLNASLDIWICLVWTDEVHRLKIKSGSVEVSRIFDGENISVAQEVDFKAVSSI